MTKTRIISIVLLLITLWLAYVLASKIYEPIQRQEEIAAVETKVVDKLKMIRDAQKEYIASKGTYAGKWEELVAFVDTGVTYTIQKNEKVIIRDISLRHLGDSIYVTYDTLGQQFVKDKLFPKDQFPNFDSKTLPLVPDKDYNFELFTGEVDMGGVPVQVIQVMDPKPEDRTRKKDHKFHNKRNLNFGSMEKATLEGNWTRSDG